MDMEYQVFLAEKQGNGIKSVLVMAEDEEGAEDQAIVLIHEDPEFDGYRVSHAELA